MADGTDSRFIFRQVYDNAALVEQCVENPGSFTELDWEDKNVLRCLIRFQKTSILHYYIYSMIAVESRHDYRKNDDLYSDSAEMRKEVEDTLAAYGIRFVPYDCHWSTSAAVEHADNPFHDWFVAQEDAFCQLWEATTEEVFHLLFANRSFLLHFNQSLSDYLSETCAQLPSSFLNPRGKLKRQRFVPAWLRRAVFLRDQGRCVLCQRDLSGLVNTGARLHLDHIVPLERWGINDPCNLQLLCEGCNRSKSGRDGVTSARYVAWWPQ